MPCGRIGYPSSLVSQQRRALRSDIDDLSPALLFVLAPLPNALFSQCASDDFSRDSFEPSAAVDLGRFITAIIVVTGFALPLILAHAEIIYPAACVMSIIGGGLVRHGYKFASRLPTLSPQQVYGTILLYSLAFRQDADEF